MKTKAGIFSAGIIIIILLSSFPREIHCQQAGKLKPADKPLYHDPVYDGSTDPVVICNRDKPVYIDLKQGRRQYASAD